MKHRDVDRLNLAALDPETGDPGYWSRFHARVLDRAELVLARRRKMEPPSAEEFVVRWGRMLAPLVAAAAALAGLTLLQSGTSPQAEPLRVEDLLAQDGPESDLMAMLTGVEFNGVSDETPGREW
jgi:hypothetical protein